MENPKELKYSKDHEWVKVEDDIVTVGITDHAQNQLTDIVFIELPEVGKAVEQDGNLGVVESVKSVSDVLCPVSGEVTEINSELETAPEKVNNSPYDEGWMVKIKLSNPSELDTLITAEEYEKQVSGE